MADAHAIQTYMVVVVVIVGAVSLFVIVAFAMLLVWAHVICVGKINKRCMH